MIRIRYLRSFDESFDALPAKEQAKARKSIERLMDYFDGGPRPLGLGLRKLEGDYWEIRAGLDRRIFFSLEDDLAAFIVAGNHDDVRRRLHGR